MAKATSGEMVAVPADLNFILEKQLAQMLGLSVATMARYRAAGDGPAFSKTKSKIYYRVDDVRAWLNKHRSPAPNGRGRKHGR